MPCSVRDPNSCFHRYSSSSRHNNMLASENDGAICFSNLVWASVLIPILRAVFLITTGSNWAISMSICVVSAWILLLLPQTIPARAKIPLSSQITISCSVSVRSVSKRSINCSVWCACLTTIVPSI